MDKSQLRDNRGTLHPTVESAQAATVRNEKDDAARAATAKAEAVSWEDQLKQRYLSTPGATDADWLRDKASVISDARKANALSDNDRAREAFARSYQ